MRQTVPIVLIDGVSGLPTSATLTLGITLPEMEATDTQWMPFLQQAVQDALLRGVSHYDLPEHKHWEWERKAQAMTSDSLAIAIEAANETQALMIVRSDKTGRLSEQSGLPLVYIDYLAAAPWNLSSLMPTPRFIGTGAAW